MIAASRTALAALGLGLAIAAPVFAEVTHPLDPLSPVEIDIAVKAIAATGRTTPTTHAAIVALA